MKSYNEALDILKQGNQRYVHGVRSVNVMLSQLNRAELAKGQSPYAIILSCADSRAPAEILFDCGLGDLFVVRVAGNIVAPSLLGSIEFAVSAFKTALIVVMGHTNCGAIQATLQAIDSGKKADSDNINEIVTRIQPSLQNLPSYEDPASRCNQAVRANIHHSVMEIKKSAYLRDKLLKNEIKLVGAEYNLETGNVDFFENT